MKALGIGASLALLGLLAASVAACDGGGTGSTPTPSGAKIPTIEVNAGDYTFGMPDTVAGGLVTFKLTNAGKEPHQANIGRLHDGTTKEQFEAALKANPDSALGMLTFVGGPNTVDPTGTQSVTVDLKQAGTYAALCFVSGADGIPHLAKGMLKIFTVTAPAQPQPVEPKDGGVVGLKDFTVAMPPVKAGTVTLKVWNQGPQPHELTFLKLAEGKTLNDVMAFFKEKSPSGPPPFASAGGIGALAPSASGWTTQTFTAGHYLALCFVPDPASGKAHLAMGMVTSFTVA